MSDGDASRDWHGRAACRGPQAAVFYPPDTGEQRDERRWREAQAKAICEQCAVVRPVPGVRRGPSRDPRDLGRHQWDRAQGPDRPL